ncbi:MAG: ImmA/IrrE family metallo-endopeptidase, partial [Eubacteriales bacterium]|nr:ImmA/IrrE family metallo-endopeptidase [Eubacteriales bacterium]
GLRVSFARLSPDGSICGVTAYADTEYKITELGITRTLALKRNQVILDESFILSGNVQRLCAKRRFTLAHECAHQILFQLESEEVRAACEMKYSARTAYTPRELKTREDWNEWQANVFGAAILLPQKEVDLAMRRFSIAVPSSKPQLKKSS